MQTYAVIDIGSLKVKLLIAEADSSSINTLKKDSILTCLGEGLKEGAHQIKDKPLSDTLKAIRKFMQVCKKHKVTEIKIVATESLRKAKNIDEVLQTFKSETKLTPQIISQKEEAKTFFKAVTKDFPEEKELTVTDMGGGSIQVLIGSKGNLKAMHFLPLGVYFLQQRFVSDSSEDGKLTDEELDQCEKYIKHVISSSSLAKNIKTLLVYGSSNVLDLFQFIKLKLSKSSLSTAHPFKTQPRELLKFLRKIKDLTHKEREEKYPFQWGYMWGIQAAFLNAYHLAKHLGTKTIIPSDVNIAEGYVLEMVNKAVK